MVHNTMTRVNDWLLLFNANRTIVQLYHYENKFLLDSMMSIAALY